MSPEFAIAQLRHLYEQLSHGRIRDQAEVARGLLGPAIAALEPWFTPGLVPLPAWDGRVAPSSETPPESRS